MWNWCNSVTVLCVKLYYEEKSMTYYFPYLEEKYFCLYCVFFPLGKKNSIVHFILLIVVFSQGKCCGYKYVLCICTTLHYFK